MHKVLDLDFYMLYFKMRSPKKFVLGESIPNRI